MNLDNSITGLLLGRVHQKQLLLEGFKPVVPKLFLIKFTTDPMQFFNVWRPSLQGLQGAKQNIGTKKN